MTYRAKVLRDTQTNTSDNPWGQRGLATMTTLHTSLPCYVWADLSTQTQDDQRSLERVIVHREYKVLVPLGTDILENDVIEQIVDRIDRVFIADQLRINAVSPRAGHLELTCESFTSGV